MVLPGMHDGRCFTTYISACEVNARLMKQKNMNSNAFRKYLQENAEELMKSTNKICTQSVSNECKYCIDIGKP
jgi:hypothetical protein